VSIAGLETPFSILLFSLPIRDGNPIRPHLSPPELVLFSLPIRDGNVRSLINKITETGTF